MTINDYEELSIEIRTKYDLRSFCEYLRDVIFSEHFILSLFFRKALFLPRYIRIIKNFTYIFFYLTINTILFSDSEISTRLKMDIKTSITFEDKILYALPKTAICMVCNVAFNYFLGLFLIIPPKHKNFLNKALKTKNMVLVPGI